MSQYWDLDKRIIAAIRAQQNPLYADVVSHQGRLAGR